jgi:iron(III)-enterobactin esterase
MIRSYLSVFALGAVLACSPGSGGWSSAIGSLTAVMNGDARGGAGSGNGSMDWRSTGGSDVASVDVGHPDANRTGFKACDPGTKGDGDITISPPYAPHPDVLWKANNPHGKVYSFILASLGTLFEGLDNTLANPHTFMREVRVYVPKQYVDGTPAPFMVVQDGDSFLSDVQNTLDNLIAAKKIPVMLAVFVNNGGGDLQGSERSLEYDTMSERYSRFVDTNVLPAAQMNAGITADYPNLKFTDDPDGRLTYGCSSGGAAALTQGWFTPNKYRRIVTYSGTFVHQQDGKAPEGQRYPLGAWEYHSSQNLIGNSPAKPLRIFLNVNENDLNWDSMFGDMQHNWIIANQRTAAALKRKGYHYRFVYAKSASHCDIGVRKATLPDTLQWMWQGYPIN